MRFSPNLKKCLAVLMCGGLALWLAGCGESSSTPKPSSGSSSTASKGSGDAAGKTPGSASEGANRTGADDEQAGSSTGGRDVPEAAPANDKDEAK